MPPRPASSSSSGSSSTDSSDSDSSSAVSTPKTAPRAVSGARGAPEDAAAAAVRYMDDDELNDKMRRAQERLKGLDNHVADLRKRSVEHDAVSKGKLPPEQTAAYLEKVKDLEAKRRELLERQMDVGEKLQRAATTNGTLNQHRHGGTPRPEREHNRRELVDRLRREEGAARKRLAAYKGGSGWNEADAAHRAAVDRANADAAEAAVEAERERERERLAALGRRYVEDEPEDDVGQPPAPPPRGGGGPPPRHDPMRQSHQHARGSNRGNYRDGVHDDEDSRHGP